MRNGVLNFQPARMLQAREARGMTQAAVAAYTNKSPPTISKWENGAQVPEAPALTALAAALGVPEQFLLRPIPATGESPFFFRSNQAITKEAQSIARRRLEWLNEVSGALQDWVDWPVVTVPRLGDGDYRKLTDQDIEAFAAECRRVWKLGTGPIENMVLVLENAGVICVREELGYDRMDGVSKWFENDGRPYVFLSSDKANAVRSRFDAAHELGHLVMHWNVATIDYTRQPELERQAHLFAAAFLLPSETFAAEVSSPSLDTFLALKPRWKVSVAAMIMRCKQLEIIDEAYGVRLWKNYSARGWRRGEPLDDTHPFEAMRLLPRAVNMVVEATQMSKAALLERLGFFGGDAASLCSLPEGYFETQASITRLEPAIRMRDLPSTTDQPTSAANVLPFTRR
jgi:Zn-dependent peptidase ImmA (M78 family)/transcriptional regulator with XRE-family HTH domain